MSLKRVSAAKSANTGERMIEIKVRFWTNDLSGSKGKILPKHAWTSGVVRMESNKSHGIKPKNPKPFHTLMDLNSVIEKVLIAHGIKLHGSRVTQKYLC